MKNGKLYLLPSYLSKQNDASFIAPSIIGIIKKCNYYLVENVRSARRFISSLKTGVMIEELQFAELNKKSSWDDLYPLFEPIRNGHDMGIISEAGLPCLADPGNLAVTFAHQSRISVVPMPGASSIQMALIGSGFNGQQFTFHGYLPIDKLDRKTKIKELEKESQKGVTQLFMETPYRNIQLLKDILSACRPDTLLSISADISGAKEMILTQPVRIWEKTNLDIQKIPAIFSFGQFP